MQPGTVPNAHKPKSPQHRLRCVSCAPPISARTMDLDDFDAALAALPLDDEPIVQSQDAKEAVAYIDREWYTLVNRRGRWMDLIGDYAGSEPFVVDGMY